MTSFVMRALLMSVMMASCSDSSQEYTTEVLQMTSKHEITEIKNPSRDESGERGEEEDHKNERSDVHTTSPPVGLSDLVNQTQSTTANKGDDEPSKRRDDKSKSDQTTPVPVDSFDATTQPPTDQIKQSLTEEADNKTEISDVHTTTTSPPVGLSDLANQTQSTTTNKVDDEPSERRDDKSKSDQTTTPVPVDSFDATTQPPTDQIKQSFTEEADNKTERSDVHTTTTSPPVGLSDLAHQTQSTTNKADEKDEPSERQDDKNKSDQTTPVPVDSFDATNQPPTDQSESLTKEGSLCGCNETSIISKLAEQFKQGVPGPPGVDGKPGVTGIPGAQGPTGPTGPPGPAGDKGERGADGKPGLIGLNGKNGEPGSPGSIGPPGPAGNKGDRGADGKPGQNGVNGRNGVPGLPGSKGEIGPTGPQGPPGPTPVISNIGCKSCNKGNKGNQGDRGKPGSPGPPGPTGPAGKVGHPGNPGRVGSPGNPGPPGSSAVIAVTNKQALIDISDFQPIGTIVYLREEEVLLVRINKSWQQITMGCTFLPASTSVAPPTISKQPAPSATNNLVKIADGPSLKLVALNEPFSGDMGGIPRVDLACFRQARQAGLRGTFRAFLASRVQNLNTIVRSSDREYPVVNLKGEVLFRTWNDMYRGGRAGEFASSSQHDIYSFNNRNIFNDIVWPQKVVWHGAGPNGERQLDSYCNAWTSNDPKSLGVAASLNGTSPQQPHGRLLSQEKFSCNNKFVVLCIEVASQGVRRIKRDTVEHIISEEHYQAHLQSLN